MKPASARNLFFAAISIALFAACDSGSDDGSASSTGGSATPTFPVDPGTLGDGRMPNIVEVIRARHDLPALGAIIVSEGQIVDQGTAGLRAVGQGAAVTTEDQWHLGSVTKSMTATLAAILVEQSVISWDTTPLDVWPELAATMDPQYQSATVVDLLSHQSGLAIDVDTIPSINDVIDEAPGTVTEKRRLWAAELLELSPANAIGEFLYTNAGYIVVGAMLETVTGSPWETLMAEQLFGPLGMTSTGFGAPGSPGMLDQPWGHWELDGTLSSIQPGSPNADNPQAIGPAGTVHTTFADYARYLFAHIEGERGISGIVTAETFQFLHAPVRDIPYALGWDIDNSQDWTNGSAYFHFGSNGRWIAIAVLIPNLDVGVLMVSNTGSETGIEGIDALVSVIAQRIQDSQ